ncbi:MAG: DNA-directed RNA polymerase subunit omega [Bryobacterales bacterium]|nr:DNA-directed RNA polymerase subunit omega [Bryobacterales bacterium]
MSTRQFRATKAQAAAIPDDPERSRFRFITVAARRARQLQAGARPYLLSATSKPTAIAMEEVRRGLVEYEVLDADALASMAEAQ